MNDQQKKPAADRPSTFVTVVGIAAVITALCNFGGIIPWPVHQLCIAAGFGYGALDKGNTTPKVRIAFGVCAVIFVGLFVFSLVGMG